MTIIMDKNIMVGSDIRAACPDFVGAAVYCQLENSAYSAELWAEIKSFLAAYQQKYTVDSLKEMPTILATRQAYRKCGKDPSRYRPSGEALVRRTLQGKELYQIDTAVDLINLASIAYGYSIGGFDYDKISGNEICLGIGREGEPYEGIGRGVLNIAGLPVYRDAIGGIGTPTSDNERTKLGLTTTRLLSIVNGYDGNRKNVRACADYIRELVEKFAKGHDCVVVEFA